jgi:hypothetical protein
MIETCNFRSKTMFGKPGDHCILTYYGKGEERHRFKCSGEDNCVIFQTYKTLQIKK